MPEESLQGARMYDAPVDCLGAEDIAEQLWELVEKADGPTAVALFGSWGIGKSTIGRLLKRHVPNSPGLLQFDASRGSVDDLAMNLLVECARHLGESGDRLAEGLRAERKRSLWGKKPTQYLRVLGVLALALLVLIATGLGIAWIVSVVSGATFRDVANDYVLALVLAPAVAAGLIALAAKGLVEELTVPAALTPDRLATEFETLLARKGVERLVVFVDELDARQHEEILPALRSVDAMLRTERSVFVVAGDRRLFEYSLSATLGERTGQDVANPYYSAGSAYLDKFFQRQLTVPPLRTYALYDYAQRQVGQRKDQWEQVTADGLLLRVLIPPHVTSPRQVDTLLRGFELTYRLLIRRLDPPEKGAKGGDRVAARAREIAKLVCLRSEFPLFAADLHIDPDLPELVLKAAREKSNDAETLEDEVEPDRAARARAYAAGRLPVATAMTERHEPGGDQADTTLREEHSRQLIRYLDETENVEGPGRDVIHAQGMDSELPPEQAEKLAKVATKGTFDDLEDLLIEIRDWARDEARGLEGGSVEDAVRAADREVLHLLSRRARSRNTDDSRCAIVALLRTIPHCRDALDVDTAQRVAWRLELYLNHLPAPALNVDERRALCDLGDKAGNAMLKRHAEQNRSVPARASSTGLMRAAARRYGWR